VRCPSCKAILVVPTGLPEGDFSCPRCLTPLSPSATSAIREGSEAVTEATTRPAGLESVRPPDRLDTPDRQIKRDTSAALVVITILIGCWVVVIVVTVARGHGGLEGFRLLAWQFVILDVLVMVQFAIWLGQLRSLRQAGKAFGTGCAMVFFFLLFAVAVVTFYLLTFILLPFSYS